MNLISHTRFSVQANNLLLVIELLEKLGGVRRKHFLKSKW